MKTFLSLMLLSLLCLVPRARTEEQEDPKRSLVDALKVELLKSTPQDDQLRKLQVQRYNEVAKEYGLTVDRIMFFGGRRWEPDFPELFGISGRLLQAALDFDQPKDRVSLLRALLKLAKEQERIVELKHKASELGQNVIHRYRSFSLEVEIALVRTEKKLERGR